MIPGASKLRITISPGHGGSDPGAIGVSGIKEADLNLQVSLLLYSMLLNDGYDTLLLRHRRDEIISLPSRTAYSNEFHSDLFVSIHHDAFGSEKARGQTTIYHRGSVEGKKVAEEIRGELIKVCIMWDEVENAWKHCKVDERHDLWVLKRTICPAVVIECGFLTNEIEERILRNPYQQIKIAQHIAIAIWKYFSKGGKLKDV